MANPQEAQALKLCKDALGGLKKGDMAAAKKAFDTALNLAQTSEKVLTVAVGTMIDCDDHEAAMAMLARAFRIGGETVALLTLATAMAERGGHYDLAAKFLSRLTGLEPTNPDHYARLVDALRLSGQSEDAVTLVNAAVEKFPQSAALWNTQGLVILNILGKLDASREAFKKAVDLNPKSAIYRYNYGNAIAFHPAFCEEQYRAALALEPKNADINTALGLLLLSEGRLKEGWRRYAARSDPSRGFDNAPRYTHGLRPWNGNNPKSKSLLVCAEQGIGDEILFAIAIPLLGKDARGVAIGCEPRLETLYRRSFPDMAVSAYADRRVGNQRLRTFPSFEDEPSGDANSETCADTKAEKAQAKVTPNVRPTLAAPVGQLWAHYIEKYEDLERFKPGYVQCDPELSDRVRSLEPRLVPQQDRPRIGLSWRSGKLDQVRQFYYMDIEFVLKLMRQSDADFFCLQYSASEDELERFAAEPNGFVLDGFDLKQDIEFNFAMLDNLDLVIGPAIATQSFALAAGVPVWLVGLGRPWTFFGRDDPPPFYPENSKIWDLGKLALAGQSQDAIAVDICQSLRLFAEGLSCERNSIEAEASSAPIT